MTSPVATFTQFCIVSGHLIRITGGNPSYDYLIMATLHARCYISTSHQLSLANPFAKPLLNSANELAHRECSWPPVM